MYVLVLVGLLLLSGCMDVDSHLTPTNPQVAETLKGQDCLPVILGISVGTITVDAARKAGLPVSIDRIPYGDEKSYIKPIRNIRAIMLHDFYGLAFGERCIIVTGEP